MSGAMETIRRTSDEVTPVSIHSADLACLKRAVAEPRFVEPRLAEARFAESRCEEFLGMPTVIASPAMRRLISVAGKVGRTSSPVLITGESGTGKELIARAKIGRASCRE